MTCVSLTLVDTVAKMQPDANSCHMVQMMCLQAPAAGEWKRMTEWIPTH